MEFNREHTISGTNGGPLPSVSPIETPEIPHRVTLTECSWPFLGSIVLNAFLCEILFFTAPPPPTAVSAQTSAVVWLRPFIVPGGSEYMTEISGHVPAVAFAQQTKTAEPVSVGSPEDAIDNDLPATRIAPAPTTGVETDGNHANTDSMVIMPPPNVLNKTDQHLLDPPPAPRQTVPLPATAVSRNAAVPSPEPQREQRPVLPAEQTGSNRTEREQSSGERSARQDEEDRLSRELAAQKQERAESARQEQLVRLQTQQALREQSERERVAAEEIRQEQEAREKLQRESRILEEQGRLAAERARHVQRVREQEQQTLREQFERERVAAEKIRQEQETREKLQRESRILEEQGRLAAEKARHVQRVREQEQQALREQAERKHAAAEKLQQERESREQLLRKQKLEEEMGRRKRVEQALEQPKRELVATATKQQEIAAAKTPEKRIEKHPAQQPQKGLVLPLLKGDLKLVVSGATLPKITITFKEFALSRRDRAFSRAESRRETLIAPLVAHTLETQREYVIEKAGPGVYTITIEPVSGPSDFNCLLKLHEGAPGMGVREYGRLTLVRKTVLLKILMPDGILWDDNSAFSGNMEDSDSITKFNTNTGLMWKEYSD